MLNICSGSKKQCRKHSRSEQIKNNVQLSLIIVGDTGVGSKYNLKEKVPFWPNSKKASSLKALQQQLAVLIIKKVNFMEMKKCENDIQYQISIWDTAGQERFRSLAKSHFKKAVFKLANI
jgi:GTPase SAR1 family protein